MFIITCNYCQNTFTHKNGSGEKGKKYCSKECRKSAFSRADMWTKEEDDLIRELSELMPLGQMYREFKKKFTRKRHQILRRMHKLGISCAICSNRRYYNASELASVLNIDIHRITAKWKSRGLEYDFYESRKVYSFHIDTLKKYAARRPRDFYGIPVRKLNIIFRDISFSREVFELAFHDSFSSCFCIVRLQGGIFKSVGDCADQLVLGKSTVEHNVARELSIRKRGIHDLVKLDYPIYLAPSGYEDEFNEVAGNILIQLYADYQKIAGYSKLGIQVIAVRQAVAIALVSFRRYFYDKSLGTVERSIEAIALYWKDRYIKMYLWHFQVSNYNSSKKRIVQNIRANCYALFAQTYKNKCENYLDEFSNHFISHFGQAYFKDQYLPNSRRENKYINCDVWLFIECMSHARIKKQNNIPLSRAIALTFVKNNPARSDYNPDWLDCNVHSADEESAESEIEIILQSLDLLNLEDSYKQLCNDYVNSFYHLGNASEVRRKLNIGKHLECEIIETLRLATSPF